MTRWTRTSPALVVLAIAGLLLGPGTPAWSADKATRSHKKTTASKRPAVRHATAVTSARVLLDAQAAYAKAQSEYNAKKYDEAAATLDPVIDRLGDAMSSAPDARLRREAGDLFKKCGSLNLAAVKRRDAQLAVPPAGDPTKTAQGNSAADSAMALAGLPPADAPEIPLPNGDEPDAATMELPALEDGQNAIAIESHPMVDKWLDYFTGRGRPTFERWLNRSGLYMDSMKKTLEREGVPTDLVHLVFVESGFNPQARSYASAVGPWQFIRGTAKMFGLTMNSWVDERKDPEASTVAAARYLKHLYGLFNSWPLALASYNAGEGAVIDAVKRQGTRNFWALRLPQQTRDYVPKFMAVLTISRDPARYGFDDVELENPLAFDEVTIPGPADLRALASACGTTTEEIKRLNPMFLRNSAPAKNDMVTLRVPDGSGERLMSSLENGSLTLPTVATPDDPAVLRHKIRRGESLKSLSLNYGVPALTIARYNHLGKRGRLRVGRTLLIPMNGAAPAPAKVASSSKKSHSSSASKKTASRTVKVRPGDTLSEIAGRHGITVAQLRAMNGMSKKAVVKAGQRLKVPAQSSLHPS
jgi:membrane-bound lytic murein transglycosylase D